MKHRLQVVSTFLLIALVLSLVPAVALPSKASAAQACTDRAQFVTDVTVPDGTRYDPGATFTKTWRLRNSGTCTWTTAYTMVFDSGTQMGSTTSVNLPANTAPGATVDVSVNMTAPSAAGHYIGYWKFKNANGVIFGIGTNANRPWWVEINVNGTTTGVVYDFTANAGSATWSSGAGGLTFPGANDDPKGFALKLDNPAFEDRVAFAQPSLLFSPQQITNGYIQAVYPDFTVQNGDRFRTRVGCELNATSCYVAFRLDYQIGNTITTFWQFRERHEGWTYDANLNLSSLAGKTVKFILYMSAWGSPVGDRAIWGNPVIVRPGATTTPTPTATGTPPTPTPTSTAGTPTPTPAPSTADRVQFVKDVTIPDRTVMAPGTTFTKTWRLKNVGTTSWTSAYQLVYASGPQLGAPASSPFPLSQGQVIAPGQTIDVSINMTAPTTPGSYRSYWMFKNANGALFGIGRQFNQPWWVDIIVSGPTPTPGGSTATPPPGIAYDFAANACAASWFSRAGSLTCPGTDGNVNGFVLQITNPKLENNTTDSRPGLLTFPSGPLGGQDGYIQGIYPVFRVQTGDRFRSTINCEGGATNCYVGFRLDYQTGSDPIRIFWGPRLERYEGQFYNVDVDLSSLNGKDVKFILTVLSAGVNTGDRALWVGPHIYRAGAAPPTTATATPTGTTAATATPTGTTAATATPTATTAATATPTGTTAATATPTGTTAAPTDTPTPTGTTAAPTATPTPTGTTSSTTGLRYQNNHYNFRFSLPSGAKILSQSDNVGQVSLPIVNAGTNLRSKYIQIHVREGISPCNSPAVEHPLTSENVSINSIPFVKETGEGAAAGNRYETTAFSTTYNNACISLAFVLHSDNPYNYPTPPPEYNETAEKAVIDSTMATYNRITS